MGRHLRWLIVLAMVLTPALAGAQQNATLQGTVTDEQAAVLPGATVTATETSTGVQTPAVSEADGHYKIENLPAGRYKVRIELSGFGTTEVPEFELLVGQNVTIPKVALKVGTVQEAVTVTGEVPLVDTTSPEVAGNIDRRQMADLPLEGRNWVELSMMVKGITANNITNTPGTFSDDQFQLNLDGQQITQRVSGSGFGEPKLSREAIAEYQIVTSNYDIDQGRSTGIQVQAISRSGTNQFDGSGYGFFRSNHFNAADPVTGTVLPYSDQQTGFTLGGPIIMDKMHYFFSYEYERNPVTAVLTPLDLPGDSWSILNTTSQNSFLGKLDYQHSAKDTFTVRAQRWTSYDPGTLTSGGTDPTMAEEDTYYANNIYGTWTHVFSNELMAQTHLGVNRFSWYNEPQGYNNQSYYTFPFGVPEFSFPNGLNIGGQYNEPNNTWSNEINYRGDLTWHKGKHDMKFGIEFLQDTDTKTWDLYRRGEFVFNKLPPASLLEADFPEGTYNQPNTWNISNLTPYAQYFDVFYNPNNFAVNIPRPMGAAWMGDNWRTTNNLTINMGLRYDIDWRGLNPPGVSNVPIQINDGYYPAGNYGYQPGVIDKLDFGPRGGFAYNVGGGNDFVIRGGTGIYFNYPVSNVTYRQQFYNESVDAEFYPAGNPNFMTNPTNGLTSAQILSGQAPAGLAQVTTIIAPNYRDPYGWQSSIGMQKQLGPLMAFDVQYVDLEEYHQVRSTDVNLFYNPATGYNLDPTIYGRPNPAWGEDEWLTSDGRTQTRNLVSSFTRRFSHSFQAAVTNTVELSQKDDTTGFGYTADNQFNPFADWARSTTFQRETLRINGIVTLPWTLSLAGSYFYGSGNYFNATSSMDPYSKPGTNRLNIGAPITIPADMLSRWDGPAVIATGTTWPRDALEGLPLHKVDLRLSSRLPLGPKNMRMELMAEVFNIFNWKNYGNYNTTITSPSFGQPIASTGNAYVPREGQLGFRMVF